MARIKGGMNAKKKHNRVLKLAKGYRGARSKQYRVAKQSVIDYMEVSDESESAAPENLLLSEVKYNEQHILP